MDNFFFVNACMLITAAFAGAIFTDILQHTTQDQIDNMSKRSKIWLDGFFEVWFYMILPWTEAILVSATGTEVIWITIKNNSFWSFELVVYCAWIGMFCAIASLILIKQQYVIKYLTAIIVKRYL
jgi:hypothetical protein